jgi:hypothetical protein
MNALRFLGWLVGSAAAWSLVLVVFAIGCLLWTVALPFYAWHEWRGDA